MGRIIGGSVGRCKAVAAPAQDGLRSGTVLWVPHLAMERAD